MKIISYKDLIVWKKSIDLVREIYKFTEKFPMSERYGLTAQMRRAAISIPSNIAEGKMRSSRKDFRHFLFIALGSGAELETQIEIIKQLDFSKQLDSLLTQSLLNEIMRMLNVLINHLADPKT